MSKKGGVARDFGNKMESTKFRRESINLIYLLAYWRQYRYRSSAWNLKASFGLGFLIRQTTE